jgi:hypothetical protein
LRAAENQDDDRGRDAARALTALRESVRADEFATKLGTALSDADDAVFDWLSEGQRVDPVPPPPPVYRPDDVPIYVPPSPLPAARRAGRTTLAKGAPAREVLGPLQAFLDAHRDEQVIVEWRIQE